MVFQINNAVSCLPTFEGMLCLLKGLSLPSICYLFSKFTFPGSFFLTFLCAHLIPCIIILFTLCWNSETNYIFLEISNHVLSNLLSSKMFQVWHLAHSKQWVLRKYLRTQPKTSFFFQKPFSQTHVFQKPFWSDCSLKKLTFFFPFKQSSLEEFLLNSMNCYNLGWATSLSAYWRHCSKPRCLISKTLQSREEDSNRQFISYKKCTVHFWAVWD